MGVAESELKTSLRSLTPSCSRSTPKASSEEKGGTASCSWRSSSAYAVGMRSSRMESAWPSLMKVVPSCSHSTSASLARRGSAFLSAVYSSSLKSLPSTSQSKSRPVVKAELRRARVMIRRATRSGRSR